MWKCVVSVQTSTQSEVHAQQSRKTRSLACQWKRCTQEPCTISVTFHVLKSAVMKFTSGSCSVLTCFLDKPVGCIQMWLLHLWLSKKKRQHGFSLTNKSSFFLFRSLTSRIVLNWSSVSVPTRVRIRVQRVPCCPSVCARLLLITCNQTQIILL